MSTNLERLERLAERLRSVEPARPSPQARLRGWHLAWAAVQRSAVPRPAARSIRRLVLAFAAAAAVLVAGTVAASAGSFPDSPIYPVKGVIEDVRGLLTFGPSGRFALHLELANTRLKEARAMFATHHNDLAERALNGLGSQMATAAQVVKDLKVNDAAAAGDLEKELQDAAGVHERELAEIQSNVNDPEALTSIQQAAERDQKALKDAAAPASDKKGAKDHEGGKDLDKGSGHGNHPSVTPAPSVSD